MKAEDIFSGDIYPATVTGNTDGIYLYPGTDTTLVNIKECDNYSEIRSKNDITGIVVKRDNDGRMKIIQASGYSYHRGLFCDLY